MAAKLPTTRLQLPSRKLSELPVGAEGAIFTYAIRIDLDQGCYWDGNTDLCRKSNVFAVRVWRDAQGFHLDLRGNKDRFEPRDLTREKAEGSLIPVQSIRG